MDIICIINYTCVCVQVSGSSGALPLTPVVGEQGSSQCSLPLLLPAEGQLRQPDAAGSHQPAVLCLARRHCQRCLSPAASQLRSSSDVQVGENGVQMCILYHVLSKLLLALHLSFSLPLSLPVVCQVQTYLSCVLGMRQLQRCWTGRTWCGPGPSLPW